MLNLSLYFIADPECCGGRDVVDVARAAVRGGVTIVQYRDKTNAARERAKNARALKDALNVPLLINDHVDTAIEVNAHGVHLGQGDMPVLEARDLLGPEAIIGLTAFTEDHIAALDAAKVDYIGTGPFYPTQTDKGKPVLGAERFAALAALSPVPIVGIGGITPDNAAAVIEAGASGVAVMRAIGEADDPEEVAAAFKDVLS